MKPSIDLREHKEMIVVFLSVFIALFFSKKIWVAYQQDLSKTKQIIEAQEQSISLAKDIEKLSKEIEKYKKSSWDTRESVVIMGRINELATKHNIIIHAFDPGSVQNSGNFSVLTMNLNISAQYIDIIRFLSALENLPTITKLKTLDLQPQGKQNRDSMFARAYVTVMVYLVNA